MRRVFVLVLASSIALTACSSHTPSNSVTVQNSEGTMRIGKNVVDLASLGAPIYPGAHQDESALSVSGVNSASQMAAFTTTDTFEKVCAFYRSKMPAGSEKLLIDHGENSAAEFVLSNNNGAQTTVMITRKSDKTSIIITKSRRKASRRLPDSYLTTLTGQERRRLLLFL